MYVSSKDSGALKFINHVCPQGYEISRHISVEKKPCMHLKKKDSVITHCLLLLCRNFWRCRRGQFWWRRNTVVSEDQLPARCTETWAPLFGSWCWSSRTPLCNGCPPPLSALPESGVTYRTQGYNKLCKTKSGKPQDQTVQLGAAEVSVSTIDSGVSRWTKSSWPVNSGQHHTASLSSLE